jgi:hypothetical protein
VAIPNKYTLVHRPWKIKFDIDPKNATASLESLWDLMYTEHGDIRYLLPTKDGWNLHHDVICFDPSIYDESCLPKTETFDKWCLNGIDICPAFFDNRSKPLVIGGSSTLTAHPSVTMEFMNTSGLLKALRDSGTIPVTAPDDEILGYVSNEVNKYFKIMQDSRSRSALYRQTGDANLIHNPNVRGFKIEDKDAAIFPVSVQDVMKNSTAMKESDRQMGTDVNSFQRYQNRYRVCPDDRLSQMVNPDICLTSRDIVFDSMLQSKNMMGYVGMCLNPSTDGIRKLYMEALNIDPYELPETELFNKIKQNQILRYAAQHTYVWVRCMFWADYVNPENFQQNLDVDADVVHGNIMATIDGDFRRYDDSLNAQTDTKDDDNNYDPYRSEETKSYVPKTTPIIDLVTDEIAAKALNITVDMWKQKTWKQKLDLLERVASVPGNLIGGVFTDTVDRNSASLEENQVGWQDYMDLAPPTFFNPESRKPVGIDDSGNRVNYTTEQQVKVDTYADSPGTDVMPLVLPKYGNIVTDGRVMSPTIDELWIYIKKLVMGREPDISQGNLRAYLDDKPTAYGKGNRQISKDTRLPIKEYTFWQDQKDKIAKAVGDPIDFEVANVAGAKPSKSYAKITEWVNRPDAVLYRIYNSLIDLDKNLIGYQSPTVQQFANRSIRNFTAKVMRGVNARIGDPARPGEWNNVTGQGGEIDDITVSVLDPITNTPVNISDEWRVREKPFSLRELEIFVKGLKFNLETLAEYIIQNFATTSIMARHDQVMGKSGALYQFHAEFIGDVNAPNTIYTDDPSIPSPRSPEFTEDTNNLIRRSALTESTVAINSSSLDGYSKHKSGNAYDVQDVYLSAEGKWRYIWDCVKLPITVSDW